MRAIASAAAAFASVAIATAYAPSAHAQSTGATVADSGDAIAPIEIVATPPLPAARPAVSRVRFPQSLDRPEGATVTTRITSLGGRVEIAFATAAQHLPRESELRYLCYTPCEVSLPGGWYHLVARSDAGWFRRYVNVEPNTHFYVTPRQSRALANGLFVPGIITAIAGSIMLIPSALFAASSFPPSNTGAMWIATGALLAGGAAFTIGGGYFMHESGGAVRTAPNGAPLPWRTNPTAAIVPMQSGAIAVATARF